MERRRPGLRASPRPKQRRRRLPAASRYRLVFLKRLGMPADGSAAGVGRLWRQPKRIPPALGCWPSRRCSRQTPTKQCGQTATAARSSLEVAQT